MGRWSVMLLLALAVVHVTARDVPNDKGVNDQKNFVTFGGIGGYSGLGSNGLPIGGIVGGVGAGGGIGGGVGLGGLGGLGGGVGGGAGGGTGGAGSGVLPYP